MSFLSVLDSMLPVASNVVGAAAQSSRPLIGFGVFAALVVFFKPLLSGIARAAMLVVSPRQSLEQRELNRRVKDQRYITELARNLEIQHPGLASELRSIALRD